MISRRKQQEKVGYDRAEWLTGDTVLDGWLVALEGLLWGSKRVRWVTLAEVMDLALSQRDRLMGRGLDRDGASRRVVAGLGAPTAHAAMQRRLLARRFGLMTGLGTALLSACWSVLFGLLLPQWGAGVVGLAMGGGLACGLAIAVVAVWLMPPVALPSEVRTRSAVGGLEGAPLPFEAALPPRPPWTVGLILAAPGLVMLYGLVTLKTWADWPEGWVTRMPWWSWLVLCLVILGSWLWLVRIQLKLTAVVRVEETGLVLERGWLGKKQVAWSAIRAVGSMDGVEAFFGSGPYLRALQRLEALFCTPRQAVHFIDYRVGGDGVRRLYLLPTMTHVDRLLAVVRTRCEGITEVIPIKGDRR